MSSDDPLHRLLLLEAENSALKRELALARASHAPDTTTSTGADLEKVVQQVIDIGVELVGAQFGAFFYNTVGADGQQLMLYALSGAPREAFSKFPIPRRTALFGPTFDGQGVVRIDDVLVDRRYGLSPPYHGMPPGHLPVRSYLSVSVISTSGDVLGGLFFGHADAGVFAARTEPIISGVAQLAAIAVENSKLFRTVLHSERRFKALIENSSDGIVVFDANGIIRYVSPSVTAIEGYAAEEVIGTTAIEHMHPDELSQVREFFQRVLASPDEKIFALYRRRHKDGRWLWLEGITVNLLDDPAVRGIVTNFRDVTDRKRAAEAQIQSQKMEALGTLAGGIAHDFNNLLLAITGNTKLAASDLDPQHPTQQSLSEIARAGQRATDLVARILAFSRQQEPKRETTQLQRIVEEALHLLRATIPANVRIESSFAADVPPVCADASQIHQVIMNLVTNASHAIGARPGKIEVFVNRASVKERLADVRDLPSGDYARITITDSGCGMTRETMARMFDPFFTTKPMGHGTGLGLSVAHGIIQAHGGAIAVYSQLDKGTAFHIYLPASTTAAESVELPHTSAARGSGERVLYVDDDDAIVFLTQRILKRLGYQVTGHSRPREAVQAFREAPNAFDVVVTDLSMPEMSGFDIAREIRAIRSDVPILITSGYVRPEDREAARAQGILDVIAKPNTVEELGRSLDAIFRNLRAGG